MAAWACAQACGFPDHSFIDDDEFNNTRATGGTGTTDGGSSGGVGNGTGGGSSSNGGMPVIDASTGKAGEAPVTDARVEGGPVDPRDAAADASDAATEAGMSCDPDHSPCGDVCVDLLTDDDHCGDCTRACTAPEVCTGGVCQAPCQPGLTNCSGTCVDLDTDEDHCGGCNRTPCAPGDVCVDGSCVVDCGSLTRCGTRNCFDTNTDDTHCGNCTTNCRTTGQICVGGSCATSCSAPFTACGSTCVNTQTDDSHCGSCPRSCQVGEDCVGGTCVKLVENCQNGTDDDEDQLIDCQDPDCNAGFTCAGTPAGWNGPVAVWTGSAGSAPSCSASGGYPTTAVSAYAGLSAPAAGCGTCTCSPSPGMSCAPLAFEFDTSTDCTHVYPWQDQEFVPTTSCTHFGLCCTPPTARSALLVGSLASYVVGGTCQPSQPPPTVQPPAWSNEVRACEATATAAGGCAAGQCMRKPTAPFGSSLCVYRAGTATCPAEYPVQRPGSGSQYYQSVSDTRSCTACSCNSSCGGTITTYTNSSCTQGTTVLNLNTANGCTTVPGLSGGGGDDRYYKFTNAGPTCGVNPSTPVGGATPQSPITVCCQ